MIKCLRRCQQRCSGTAQVSRVGRFVRYLCQVVFIRTRMRPICCLGCKPSPSSQQVFCAVLCVTVSAWLGWGEIADCFEFSQYTGYSSAQLSWTNACAHTQKLNTHALCMWVSTCKRTKALRKLHLFLPERLLKGLQSLGHTFIPYFTASQCSVTTHWSNISCADYNTERY